MTNEIKRLNIWGRDFEIEILYEEYEDEGRTHAQDVALNSLLGNWSVVNSSLDAVKRFCAERYPNELEAISGGRTIDNIFRYVMPESLFVLRREGARALELLCRSRLDPEHGLAVYFENEAFAGVGTEGTIF